jgi:hypothetical protein
MVATSYSIAAGKVGLFLFDGVAGGRYGVGITNLVMSPSDSGGYVSISVYKPDGTPFSTTNCGNINRSSGGGSCDIPWLPSTGTYTIRVDPVGTYTANFDLTVSAEAVHTLTLGTAQPFTTARVGQNASFTFNGTALQNYSLVLTGNTFPGASWVYVFKPDGTELTSNQNFTGSSLVLDLIRIPATGVYTVYFMPTGLATGSITAAVQADIAGVLTVNDPPISASLVAGQSLSYSFTGLKDARYGLGITNLAMSPSDSGGYVSVSVYKPDHTLFSTTNCGNIYGSSGGGSCDIPWLPAAGTYTVRVNPVGLYTANFNLAISAEVTGVLPAGLTQPVNISRVGQNANYTFDAVEGQSYSLVLTGNTFPGTSWVYVFKPDGGELTSNQNFTGSSLVLDLIRVPSTGTYTVYFMPTGLATGSLNMTLYPDVSGTLTAGDPAISASLAAGQNLNYTFTGTQNTRFGLGITNLAMSPSDSGGYVSVSVYKPDHALFSTTNCVNIYGSSGGSSCDIPWLPSSGTYTVRINPVGLYTASFDLAVLPEVMGTLIQGVTATFSTSRVGQNFNYTFNAVQGQSYSLVLTGNTFPGTSWVYVFRPDGTELISNKNFTGSSLTLNLPNLQGGTYTIYFMPGGLATGQVDATLN